MNSLLPNHRHIFYFGYARTALEYGLRYLGLQAGDDILCPAYICDVMMVPFNRVGIKVSFYDLNEDLTIDFTSISAKLTPRTKALLAVNYFGFPQPIEKVRNFCRDNGLYFIEDSAHSFLTNFNGHVTGTHGDISILSFRKMVPLINGAALVINLEPLDGQKINAIQRSTEELPSELSKIKKMKAFLHRVECNYAIPFTMLRKAKPEFVQPGHTEQEYLPYRIDPQSMSILSRVNYKKLIKRRRDKFMYWMDLLVSKGFKPIHDSLDDGVVPLGCPFYIDNRDEHLASFMKKGVRVTTWPTLPAWVGHHCGNAVALWNKLIVFPL